MGQASRCFLSLSNVGEDDSSAQIQVYLDQDSITSSQSVNFDAPLQNFFLCLPQFNNWAFSAISQQEILFNSFMGVLAVSVVAFLLIGHWTAAVFVTPLITILYVDLMGILRWAGYSISPITTVALVISIGLLVDYVLHILVRFYESDGNRTQRAQNAVLSIGPAVLKGALTTLLGTVPLAFSTSTQFQALFASFLTIVLLGAVHGLIVVPMLLSYLGPNGKCNSISTFSLFGMRKR